ncbi:MAG TPA: ChaN family lipoprotein [Vicinamibacterales bacterium]|nr:ChaN family lipoprotein [Vicinamibacterales bacterium]
MAVLALLVGGTARSQQRYGGVVDRIVEAWKTADVVCLGEDHDRFYDNELRIAVVRHPAFPQIVGAVVVEMANPIHQDLLDRFALDGAEMSREELAPIWRDATNPEVWESPIYEQLLRAIHDVNAKLPRSQRVRILAGDSKVDWSKIARGEDLVPFMNRGGNIREIIATQVLDAHLKALAIYGAGHCNKLGTGFPGELAGRYGKEKFWSISPLIRTTGVEKGRVLFGLGAEPAYVLIAGSRWEATPVDDLLLPALARFRMGQVYDAIVYHGDVLDRVVPADMDIFRARMGPELDRRARILADAIRIRKN